jgi:hypothetical protein
MRFVGTQKTARGEVLVRPDGKVAPLDKMYVYPISDFVGRDLVKNPLPAGKVIAWAAGYHEIPLLGAPDAKAPVLRNLEYHRVLMLDAKPGDTSGRFWKTTVDGQEGWVDLQRGIRKFSPAPRNPEIGANERWIDIDIDQQTVALYEGDRAVYVTLTSTGREGHGTPQGIFRISDKTAYVDMMSRDDEEDEAEIYWVEAVPWTMHFAYRYALHAAWWHWGYGNKASHGCVNLSPRDAKELFERSEPALPAGWHTVYETAEDLGTTVRIRYGDRPVRDRRVSPAARWKGQWDVVGNQPKAAPKAVEGPASNPTSTPPAAGG